jgi:cardiolipin synthase A/B
MTASARPLGRVAFPFTTRPLVYGGNRIGLLKNGSEYFPRLLAAIEHARRSVHVETYIFALDVIGLQVADALAAAAARGLQVRLLVDGFGADDSAAHLMQRLRPAGVEVLVFRPGRWWRLDRRLLRRMHRKIVVIDGELAFVGGINIIDDYHHHGAEAQDLGPRYDYAVTCEGPIVGPITFAVERLWWTVQLLQRPIRFTRRPRFNRQRLPASLPEDMRAALLLRDNLRHRRTIARAYLDALASAHDEVIIAMAYFLPGRRLREALIAAAQRGVKVRLLLQGKVEYRLQHYAQQALYGPLLRAGIEIHEYTASFLHAKVAVVDERWATVGSSNIDPYSLLFAREANVAIYDATFARRLRADLQHAITHESVVMDTAGYEGRGWLLRWMNRIAYNTLRLLTLVAARRADD